MRVFHHASSFPVKDRLWRARAGGLELGWFVGYSYRKMPLKVSSPFLPLPLGRALRISFYYALLLYFLWLLFGPLVSAFSAWRGSSAAWPDVWRAFLQNFVLVAFVVEAVSLFVQERSLSRSTLVRLLRYDPSHEADLFYWNLYSAIAIWLMRNNPFGAVFPLLDLGRLPSPAGALAFLLVASFAQFLVHLLSHRIPALWELHKVHHSITELNIASSRRDHFFTWAMNMLILVAFRGPMDMAGSLVFVFATVSNLLQHTPLDFRLGWLGYVFISPHAHRIHHLRQPELHNRNFGSHIALWDQLFGTFQYEVALSAEEMERSFGLAPADTPIPIPPIPAFFAGLGRSIGIVFGRPA